MVPVPVTRAKGPGGKAPKACAGLRSRVEAAVWIVDTGANDDIADPTADSEGNILESWVPREKEVLEAVGKQVTVQEHGRVSIPHLGETNEALLVLKLPELHGGRQEDTAPPLRLHLVSGGHGSHAAAAAGGQLVNPQRGRLVPGVALRRLD